MMMNLYLTLYTVLPYIPVNKMRLFMQYFEDYRTVAQLEGNIADNMSLLSEFTRLLQQGADKKSSIQERCNIMKQYIYEFLDCN